MFYPIRPDKDGSDSDSDWVIPESDPLWESYAKLLSRDSWVFFSFEFAHRFSEDPMDPTNLSALPEDAADEDPQSLPSAFSPASIPPRPASQWALTHISSHHFFFSIAWSDFRDWSAVFLWLLVFYSDLIIIRIVWSWSGLMDEVFSFWFCGGNAFRFLCWILDYFVISIALGLWWIFFSFYFFD